MAEAETSADNPAPESAVPNFMEANLAESHKTPDSKLDSPISDTPAVEPNHPGAYVPPPRPVPYYEDRSRSPSLVDYRRYRRRRSSFDAPHYPSNPPKPSKRTPATPELGRVRWFDFKNKYVDEKQEYAIEVLVGEPKYYYQRQSERDPGSLQDNDTASELALQRTATMTSTLPERIRINSWPLLAILSNIAGEDWTLKPRVMLRPFKLISFYEKVLSWLGYPTAISDRLTGDKGEAV